MLVKIVNYVHTKCVNYAQNGTQSMAAGTACTHVTDRKCVNMETGQRQGSEWGTVNISGLFEVVALSQGTTSLNRRLAI